MRNVLAACGVLIVPWLAGSCLADEPQHERLAKVVAPYVDGQTLFVAHIDLGAVDSVRTVDLLGRLFRLGEPETARLKGLLAPLEVLQGTLPQGATADVFVVISIADIRISELGKSGLRGANDASLPFFVVVSQEGNSPARAVAIEIRRALALRPNVEVSMEQVGEALITASPRTIERLKKAQATPRPEIAAALAATGDGAVHFLFVPSADARRAFELLLPAGSKSKAGDTLAVLLKNLVWIGLGLDLPPEPPSVRVVIQTPGDQNAQALGDVLSQRARELASQSEIKDAPRLAELFERLVPKAAGDRLTLEVTEKSGSLEDLSAIVGALLSAYRQGATPARDEQTR